MPRTPPKAEPETPGYKTTEFWMTLVVILLAFALVLTDHVDGDQWLILAGAGGGAYSVSRGLAKR